MKAVIFHQHGGPEQLVYTTDLPRPAIHDNEVLIQVEATSINRVDIVIRNGYPGLTLPLPHILGGDIVGIVAECGSAVEDFVPGERVIAWPLVPCGHCPYCEAGDENLCIDWKYFGMHIPGGYAEYVAVPASNLIRLPDHLSSEQATALGVAGLTAYHGLYTVTQLKAGQIFMIWGGSGGLGTIAIQLAKAIGATVVATVGKDSKKETIQSLGADYVFNHYTDDVQAEVMKLFPLGVDTIMDYVGPATFPKSFAVLKKGGQLILCGILTGRETTLNIHQTYLRHLSIHGINLGTKQEMERLIALAADGTITPYIGHVVPLEEAAEAHRMMVSGECIGKIVLKV